MDKPKETQERKARWFRPLSSKPKTRTIIGFDIEGIGGPGGFVCGSIAAPFSDHFYTDRKAMWTDLMKWGAIGALIFAHNLEYDLPIVAGDDLWEGNLIFKKSGILWADYYHWEHRVRFMDSTNLFPHWSLKKVAKELGLPYKLDVGDLIIQLGNGAGWTDFTKDEQELIEEYCTRDAKIVQQAVSIVQEEALSLGGMLRPTLAGISMDIYRRTYHKWPWKVLPEKVNTYLRPSFYGGRVENFVFGKVENANLYDINSLYPFILRTSRFPHPSHIRMVEDEVALRYLDKWEGIAYAEVEVSNVHVPPLPFRIERKLFFPTGRYTSQWTISELRYALSNGAKLINLHWLVGTDTLFNPFEDFIDDLYSARKVYIKQGNDRHILLKLVMNSLYGRFGLNPDKGLFQMAPIPPDADWSDYEGWSTEEINGRVIGLGPFDFNSYPAYANVMFAAQVSACARIKLHNSLVHSGKDILYCDTDSILVLGNMETGEDLGQWKCQMEQGKADLLGPKEYILYYSSEHPKYKAKGVPHRFQPEYITTGVTRFKRAVKVRESIRRGLNPSEWVQIIKQHHPTLPKRRPLRPPQKWTQAYCQTEPWSLPDLEHALSVPIQEHYQDQDDLSLKYLREWVAPVFVSH